MLLAEAGVAFFCFFFVRFQSCRRSYWLGLKYFVMSWIWGRLRNLATALAWRSIRFQGLVVVDSVLQF